MVYSFQKPATNEPRLPGGFPGCPEASRGFPGARSAFPKASQKQANCGHLVHPRCGTMVRHRVGFTGSVSWAGLGLRLFCFGFRLVLFGSVQIGSWGHKRPQEPI